MNKLLVSMLFFILTIASQTALSMEYETDDFRLIHDFNEKVDPKFTLDKAAVGDVLYSNSIYSALCGNDYIVNSNGFYNLKRKIDPDTYSPSNWKINKVSDYEITIEFIVREKTKKKDFELPVSDYDRCNKQQQRYYKEADIPKFYKIKSIQGEVSIKAALKTLGIMASMISN